MASAAARSGLSMSSSANDDAYETAKWKKITYAGIATCTLLAACSYLRIRNKLGLDLLQKVMDANKEVAQKTGVAVFQEFKFSWLKGVELKVSTSPPNSNRWRGSSRPGPDGLFEKKDHH